MEVDTMFFGVYELGKELGLGARIEKVCECGYEDYAKHRDRKAALRRWTIRAYEAKYRPELHKIKHEHNKAVPRGREREPTSPNRDRGQYAKESRYCF